jgi:D-alanyl-D-alanine carboxypeptidase (penicillin-binding protein 5/6)
MDLLVIEEKIQQHTITLSDKVPITAEASRIGGSEVWLKEKEIFPLEELLYALIVRSANDAAVALAIHIAGSTESFVGMMQEKSDALGMKQTKFHTVHGLPPDKGQEPDVSSPRDLVILARELLKYPDVLRYTSTQVRAFRNGTMEMRSHNRLLGSFDGCDGLKTGYFKLGGYSIVATAKRGGNRFIAVVAGSKEKKVRDTKVRELLSKAFAKTPPKPGATPTLEAGARQAQAARRPPKTEKPARPGAAAKKIFLLVLVVVLGAALYCVWRRKGTPPTPPPGIHYQLK